MNPSFPVARGSSQSRALWLWPFLLSNVAAKSLERVLQLFRMDGLLQEQHSQRFCSLDVRLSYIAALQDDRKLGIAQQQPFGDFESVNTRHVHVKNEASTRAGALRGEELSRGLKGHRPVPEGLDQSAH